MFKGLLFVFLICCPIKMFCVENQHMVGKSSSANKNADALVSADLYFQLNNADKAIEILQNELVVCCDSSLQSYLNYKIGMAYLKEGEFENALPYLNKFKLYQEGNGDSLGIVEADIALGQYYCQLQDFSNATSVLFHALNVLPHINDNELKAKAFLGLAEVNVKTNEFSTAKSYAQKALSISSSINSSDLKLSCFNVFATLYESMGDYQSALYYKNKSSDLQDSILKEADLSLLRNKSSQSELSSLSNDVVLDARTSVFDSLRQQEDGWFYYLGIALLIGVALMFFILYRSKVALNRKLRYKNIELENLNATKDKFFSIIAHDLKSPFNSLMGFSEVLSLQVENKSQREIMEYSRSIHNSTRKLYSLVETLLQWSRTQLGTMDYKPEKIDIRILASNIVSILKINAEEKDIVISIDIENDLIAWADKELFNAVLRNLVSNAIKFSRVGSVINVAGKPNGKFVEMSITDTGVGISKENLIKIFKVDSNVSTIGTFNEKGTGLGLVLCKEFVEINKGVISADSKLEKGSTFKFTVPLSTNYSLN